MRIGLVGKPNVGKSTFYAAATLAEADIGDYPFTTIDANRGMAFVRVPDPGPELGVVSTPRTGRVEGDTRLVPVELVDVAGLVPGAHEGKGLGNKFLGDLSRAHALVHVIDASGHTDIEGNPIPAGGHDPLDDAAFLEAEITAWIEGMLRDGWDRFARRAQQEHQKPEVALAERLSGIAVPEGLALAALRDAGLAGKPTAEWPEEALGDLAAALRRRRFPFVYALNKADLTTDGELKRLAEAVAGTAVPVSAQSELALGKGAAAGALRYIPGGDTFQPGEALSDAQKQGLEYVQTHVLDRFGTTGIHAALEAAVFDVLAYIPVFPVEDETHFTDKQGRVLPDCHLVPRGTTAKGLAYRVHTDLGDHFVRAIDCRTHRAVAADHALEPGSVIKIAANR